MRSTIHEALLSALAAILRPTVRLLLQSGISFSEFTVVAKTVFVHVATEEYKKRGRPANYSQVSATTGISRREVSKIRDPDSRRWTPNMETSPVNTILHQWHFDADFSDGDGTAQTLPFEGPRSFSTLVERYVADIPPGAMRTTLQKAGVIKEEAEGQLLSVSQTFFYSRRFDEDFIRGLAFSLGNLGSTAVHNALLHQRAELSHQHKSDLSRLERGVWSEYMSREAISRFKAWVDHAAPRFLEEANHVIGESELPRTQWADHQPRAVGVAIYYYEED